MILPELQDLAEFDAPEFGQDLPFLGNDSDERLYLQDLADMLDTPALEDYGSDLGKCAVKSGRSKQSCIRQARSKEARRKKAAKETKKKQDFDKAVQAEVQKQTGGRSTKPRSTKPRSRKPKKSWTGAPTRRVEKLKGTVQRTLQESQAQRGTIEPRGRLGVEQARLAKEDALNSISKRFRADIMPKLDAIYKMVDQGSLQTSATNEHNIIMNTQSYRRKVLNDIARISARLPKGHPLRNKMAARRRSLGLY